MVEDKRIRKTITHQTEQCENVRPVISVIICTYARAELLADALHTLGEQMMESSCYEVIVVDNDSQDNTPDITDMFCLRYSNIKYFLETRQGLSHARNRGWQEATGTYVAYIDDDCRVPEQWLTGAKEIIDQIGPAAFGGPYYAFYNSPKPYWWKDSYGAFEQSREPRPLHHHEYLRGGNMFFRRQILEALHGFDAASGMSGNKLGYGEETELQKRIRAGMPDAIIYYDPKLYVYHLVSSEKMSLCWTLRSCFMGGRCSYHIFEDEICRKTGVSRLKLHSKFVLTLLRFVADFLVRLFLRDCAQTPYLQNIFYENTVEYIAKLGRIYEKYNNCQRF